MTRRDSFDTRTLRWSGIVIASFLAAAFALTARASAQDERPPQPGHERRREPPPAAFEACQAKQADDSCTVTIRDRTIEGICRSLEDGRLFCRPAKPPGPPPCDRGDPPPADPQQPPV